MDEYEHVLWFEKLPRESQIRCAAWRRDQITGTFENWLEIHKPRLQQPPDPGPELVSWLADAHVEDSSLEMPELREEIAARAEVAQGEDLLGNPPIRQHIEDHPEIKQRWERYVEEKWWPWAETDRRLQEVQRVYTDLFSIYQKQQRLGEQYEVVLGFGFLSWKTPDGHEIRRHLITAQASLRFDSARGVIFVTVHSFPVFLKTAG